MSVSLSLCDPRSGPLCMDVCPNRYLYLQGERDRTALWCSPQHVEPGKWEPLLMGSSHSKGLSNVSPLMPVVTLVESVYHLHYYLLVSFKKSKYPKSKNLQYDFKWKIRMEITNEK